MPSLYAHYRFGLQILPGLPADVRRPIQRYRSLFDMGLHGPDFFFYHSYLSRTPIVELGSGIHNLSGREFFTRCCDRIRRNPSEQALAYLYGLLAHYCLDSLCHPYIYEQTDPGPVAHSVLESEFDRHLLTLDGCSKPYTHNIGAGQKLRREDFDTIADFYPEASAEEIHRCVRSMKVATAFLSSPEPLRSAVSTFLKLASENVRGMQMAKLPNPACTPLMEPLTELYTRAVEAFPEYLEQLREYLTYNAPLGDIFTATFDH